MLDCRNVVPEIVIGWCLGYALTDLRGFEIWGSKLRAEWRRLRRDHRILHGRSSNSRSMSYQ